MRYRRAKAPGGTYFSTVVTFARHVQYIHYNPVKRGYTNAPEDWFHSSFHDFVRNGRAAADWGEQGMQGIEGDVECFGYG